MEALKFFEGAGVTDFLNMMSILTLPTTGEITNDVVQRDFHEKKLLKNLFGQSSGYDSSVAPNYLYGYAVLMVDFRIDHIETLNEDEETMIVKGDLIVWWKDPKARWNHSDYGGIRSVTKSMLSIYEYPWLPRLVSGSSFSISHGSGSVMRGSATTLIFHEDGHIHAVTSMTMRSTCNFDFSAFPNDKQQCAFLIYGLGNDKFVFGSRFDKLKNGEELAAHHLRMSQKVMRVGEFLLNDVDHFSVTGDLDGPLANPQNPTEQKNKKYVYFKLSFSREAHYYYYVMYLPLATLVLMSLLAALLRGADSARLIFSVLFLEIVHSVMTAAHMPVNSSDGTPLIMWCHGAAVEASMVMLFGRAFIMHFFRKSEMLRQKGRPYGPLDEDKANMLLALFAFLSFLFIEFFLLFKKHF